MGYWKEARRLQIELVHKNNESQGLRNELAQLRMELSLERQSKQQAELQVSVRGSRGAPGRGTGRMQAAAGPQQRVGGRQAVSAWAAAPAFCKNDAGGRGSGSGSGASSRWGATTTTSLACSPVCVCVAHPALGGVQELQLENASLKAQLVQKTVELNNTLAEVLQLLDKGAPRSLRVRATACLRTWTSPARDRALSLTAPSHNTPCRQHSACKSVRR